MTDIAMFVPETLHYEYQKSSVRLICQQISGRYLMTEAASLEVIDGQLHPSSQYWLECYLADHLQSYV